LKKYFNVKYVLIGIIVFLLFAMFGDIFKAMVLLVIFFPLGAYSMKIAKIVPHIDVEIVSGATLLIGYLHGPALAVIYCIMTGFYGMILVSHIRFLKVVRFMVTALSAFIMAFFTNLSFNTNFIIGIILMNVIAYFVYLVLDPDPIQNITHRLSHLAWNLIVMRLIFTAAYDLINLF